MASFFGIMIKLIDVLNEMEATDRLGRMIPFSISFYTTTGEKIEVDKAVKVVGQRGGQPVFDKHNGTRIRKNPNHFRNSTRNILVLSSGQIRKLKIRLITMFNGQEVCY